MTLQGVELLKMRLIRFGIISHPQGDNLYEDKRWRCCLCCHVRTGTIALGVWHLALHMLTLAAIAVVVLHPQAINPNPNQRGKSGVAMIENDIDLDLLAALPTPLSAGINEEPQALPMSDIVSNQAQQAPKPTSDSPSKLLYGSFVYKDWFGEQQAPENTVTYQELNINIGINFCTLGITLLMIYGAIKGKSLYLMPFFCLQAFDFFVTSLSVIGYLSFVPDIRQVLLRTPNMPLRNELLALDPQFLSLLVLAGILVNLIVKLYFINVVWSCYKYLTIRAEAMERENCITGIVDGQNLLEIPLCPMASPGADLPDYATAISDPRFAKKPMYPVPPPPYTAVANLTVESETDERPETETPRQEEERPNEATENPESSKA